MTWLMGGEMVVVETEVDAWLGVVSMDDDMMVLHDGFVGRPIRIDPGDVTAITAAVDHPAVDYYA